MSIKAIIQKEQIQITKCCNANNLMAAIKIMDRECVNGLAVVDKIGKLVGIITGHDVVKALASDDFSMDEAYIYQYMSDKVITCSRDTSLSSALLKMKKHNIQHLVITDGDEYIAVLSMKDILDKMHKNDVMELAVLKDIAVAHKIAVVN
jgi:predicted transcriptional regulator